MTLSLAELARTIQTRKTTLRGQEIEIRALRDSESAMISRLFPPPLPPPCRNPNAGSLAPPIDDERDPGYRHNREQWFRMRSRMIVGLCAKLGPARLYEAPPPPDDELKKILEQLDQDVSGAMTVSEVVRLSEEIAGILDESAQAKARKALVADGMKLTADDVVLTPSLPRDYMRTRLAMTLQVCRSYGIDPRTVDDFDPGLMQVLMEDELIREQIIAAEGAKGTLD